MHENTPVRIVEPSLLRRLSPLSIVLAAGLVGGCANSPTRPVAENFNDEGRASMATASIEPAQAKGQFTPESFIVEGHEIKLEQQWVSEARIGAAELEARRAAAQAYQVKALANFDESAAEADAKLQTSFIQRDSGYADAELARTTHDARLYEMGRQIESRRVQKDVEFDRQESFLSASVKEWQAEVERIRSSAENEWQDALAEHDRMMATRAAVQERGQAEVDRMARAADLTEERAETKVRALRTEARSMAEQTSAEVEKLNKLIETTRIQTEATVKELTERAHSLDDELASRIAEMNAEATLLETTDADQEYGLRVSQIEVNYETALGEAEDLRLSAEELSQQNAARVARMTAEANARFESSRNSYQESIKGIHAHYSKMMADVARAVSEADRVEHNARSGFIKAEVEARTSALRETADHTRAIAKSEAEKIEAESLAEARRLQARFAKEFAEQARKGSFALPGKLDERKPGVKGDDAAPEFAKASKKPENIHPEHVASFRAGLAKATELREQAEASRLDAMAVRDSEMARFNDWWNNKQAEHRATLASVDAFRQKADADVSRLISRAESMIAQAETERGRALVEAEADRNEVYARIMALRGNSQTLDKKKDAQVRQLMAQADATARTGESKIASLIVQRDSTARRGEAKGRQLLAEAQSLESSQRAVVAQMRQDINASRQILAAELSRLGQGAESFLAVAEANYQESGALADAFERIAVANTSELAARHVASRKQAEADLEYMSSLASANELIRDADVTRIYARADEALGMGRAQDIALRGQIEAEQQVALASVTREFTVADAQETGVRSRFDQRVASTIAGRNRSYADLYQANQFQRVRAEMAAAEAASYAELSVAALERLSATAESFRQNAQRNWDSRLAMPGSLPTPTPTEELFERTNPDAVTPQFVVAPTDQ